MLFTHSESPNKAWCSEELARCFSIRPHPPPHNQPMTWLAHSLLLQPLWPRNDHTLKSVSYQFGHSDSSLGVSYLLPPKGRLCLLKCYTSFEVCFKCSDSVHPSWTSSVDNGFLQQWPWVLCVQGQLLSLPALISVHGLHRRSINVQQKEEKGKMEGKKKHGREGVMKKNTCPFHLSTSFGKQN